MTALTADQIAAKWSQNLSGATTSIQAGVQGVQVAPGALAARQKAVYVNNVNAAADKWASRVAAVPLQDWQQAMVTKGIPRIASGAQAAQGSMTQFFNRLMPYINSGLGQLPARGSLDQNINRATAWMRYMSNFSA